ncbi:spore germination protein [Cohnella thailandensis]|uniref:Spore germination protein n=2 Tax=Cohnella thailandensis TaxID=557557 RepID=A0A841SV14_9BACL|nr:spore germination protein [Cohnella thailandensis]MBP1973878.1 spore germination protein [Cohnella thailandensis]
MDLLRLLGIGRRIANTASGFGKRKSGYGYGSSDCISGNLDNDLKLMLALFTDTPDLNVRPLTIRATGRRAALVYLEGLTDKNSINNDILKPLLQNVEDGCETTSVTVGRLNRMRRWIDIQSAVLQGSSILFVDGAADAQVHGTEGWPQRAIEDPQVETSLKGAHQGFVETLDQNIALIRRYLPHRNLKIKEQRVGRRSDTRICTVYLDDVANMDTLAQIEGRIGKIDIDVIINSGELSELIEDDPYSPFPQILLTERPDTAASQIIQGRFVIVVDRSPSVLVAPVSFASFFQSVDDYSTRWSIATFIRLLRFFALLVAIFLPAFYIAVISFNFELIPLRLLLTIGEYRGIVPISPFLEAIFMELTLEMMREAGVRLPAPVGQTVGIVGGIVIGQAVVQAGLISNIMVIVVAFTAIASFILPNFDMVAAVRLLRFFMMIGAALFGIFGIMIGFMILIAHLISLESFGTPFGSPFAPVRFADWKDTMVRIPLWRMRKRPVSTKPAELDRQVAHRTEGEGK